MRRHFTVKASKQVNRRAPIKAATGADMLAAFEERLAELGVQSKTDIQCSSFDAFDKSIEVYDSDYDEMYTDVQGVFGIPGETVSLGEAKLYWNQNYDSDYTLEEYDTFQDWWNDTTAYFEHYDNRRYE